jgi:hypothetical protein
MEDNENQPVTQLSGHGALFVSVKSTARKLGEAHYDLMVVGDVVVGDAASEEHPDERTVSGTIEVIESDANLLAYAKPVALILEDGRYVNVKVTEQIPGGFRVEGIGGPEELA